MLPGSAGTFGEGSLGRLRMEQIRLLHRQYFIEHRRRAVPWQDGEPKGSQMRRERPGHELLTPQVEFLKDRKSLVEFDQARPPAGPHLTGLVLPDQLDRRLEPPTR